MNTDERTQAVVDELRQLGRPDQLPGMARYGIEVKTALGVRIPELRRIAKSIGHDHALALALWQTDIHEARILAAFVDETSRRVIVSS